MKRIFPVIMFVLLSCTLAVRGQFIESMGLKAGISIANQRHQFTPIDYTLETDAVTGPGIAVFMEAFGREHLSLQFDLAFSAKGSKSTTQSVTVNHLDNDRIIVNEGDLKVSKFYYLSFSPVARYRIEKEGIGPYVLLGPRLDYLLKYSTDSDYPLEEQNSIILGLNCGAGLEYNLNDLGVFIEVQYQPDFSPVTSQDPLRVNNKLFVLTIGIRYLNAQ